MVSDHFEIHPNSHPGKPPGTCESKDCQAPGDYLSHWPGNPQGLCLTHVGLISNVATAMGFTLAVTNAHVAGCGGDCTKDDYPTVALQELTAVARQLLAKHASRNPPKCCVLYLATLAQMQCREPV